VPANTRPPQGQAATAAVVNLHDFNMTPAMQSLHQLTELVSLLDELKESAEVLRMDAVEVALAEGQPPTDVIRIQRKPETWRAQLYKVLKRDRGIDPARNRRARNVEEPWDLPGYLDKGDQLKTTATHLERAVRKFNAMLTQREKQYPHAHARTVAAINETAIESQAS
jgi:hypothetical protein